MSGQRRIKDRKLLGFAQAAPSHQEHSSISHAIVADPSGNAVFAACGPQGFKGQVHPRPPEYAPHLCRRAGCQRFAGQEPQR